MPKTSRDRTQKARRKNLSSQIAHDGFAMPTKCYHCEKSHSECKFDLRTSRCSECARLGQSCNFQVTRIEYEKIVKQREKIARELEEAEDAEEVLNQQRVILDQKLAEHRARTRRLRKQLRLKEVKEAEAQNREFESIAADEQAERELLRDICNPIFSDLPSGESPTADGQLRMTPREWASHDEVPWGLVGSSPSLSVLDDIGELGPSN